MGSVGTAITFVARDEGKLLTAIEMLINKLIPQRRIEGFEVAVCRDVVSVPPAPALGAAAPPGLSAASDDTAASAPRPTLASRFRLTPCSAASVARARCT